ncbi:TonB-dependent siderophore receptor [Qingshengfaniella alkalisoli]|uniref:TonB-dependent siderophore receptor n=2 Tax=Qingshengfaniella alkalisoli TaxID=2599296 RepID=A0A5B8IVQ7_9RHOB|nr:TonB-dependent siderophore receptor [Qingshengfaniella alkalisoli]
MFPIGSHGLRCGTATIALLVPVQAVAQDEALVLQPINISVATDDDAIGPVEGLTNPATLTGAKTATPLSEVPQSVSVIGRDQIERENVTKVDEALRYSAGVFTQPFGDDSDTDWHFIRGFQSTAAGVYLDGLQNFSYAFGGFYIDPYTLERIEVLRGPSSVLYGGSNPGGLLNYVSKTPQGRVRETALGLNDFGTAWFNFDLGDDTSTGGWRVTGRIEGGDKDDEFADGMRGVLAPSLLFTTDAGTEITLLANYTRVDENHSGGSFLPYVGTAAKADFGYIDTTANFSEPDIDSYDREQFHIGANVAHDFGGWTLIESFRYGESHVQEDSLYAYGYLNFMPTPQDPDNELSRIRFEHDTKVRTVLSDTRVETTAVTGAVEHELLFGLDAKYYEIDQMQASGSGTPISANHPQYGASQVDPVPYIDQKIEQTQIGFYAQDQLRWGDGWIGTLNLRHDTVHTEAGENKATGAEGYDRDNSEWSWRLGLAKELANGFTPYLSASTYFSPEVVTDAGGNMLTPETGRQYEVGLKYIPEDGRSSLTVSLFDIHRNDITQSAGYDANFQPIYQQVGEVSSKGVEIEGFHDFGNGLSVRGSATKLDMTIEKDVNENLEGNTPFIVPETQAALWVDYAFAGDLTGLRAGAGARYQGESWADNENTAKVPSATLYDASVSYDWLDWRANLAVTNLFDDDYVSGCQTVYSCGYGEGREVSLTLTRNW